MAGNFFYEKQILKKSQFQRGSLRSITSLL